MNRKLFVAYLLPVLSAAFVCSSCTTTGLTPEECAAAAGDSGQPVTCPSLDAICPDGGATDGVVVEGELNCSDGIDNDGDGDADCEDNDCVGETCRSWCSDTAFWHAYRCESKQCAEIDVGYQCSDDDVCTDHSCSDDGPCELSYNTAYCDDDSSCTWSDACSEGSCEGVLMPNWAFGYYHPVFCTIAGCGNTARYSAAQSFKAPHPTIYHVSLYMQEASVSPFEVRVLKGLPEPRGVVGQVDQADLLNRTLGVTLVHPSGPGWVHAYFSPPLDVSTGETYHLFVENNEVAYSHSGAKQWKSWWDAGYDEYYDGQGYVLSGAGGAEWETLSDSNGKDFFFHVHCDHVDEPVMNSCKGGYFDPRTSLCWESQDSDADSLTYNDSVKRCEELVLELTDDWRLPTISEARSIIRGCPTTETGGSCAVDDGSGTDELNDCAGCYFNNGPDLSGCYWDDSMDSFCFSSSYWSSTPSNDSAGHFTVRFSTGQVSLNAGALVMFKARCVRKIVLSP